MFNLNVENEEINVKVNKRVSLRSLVAKLQNLQKFGDIYVIRRSTYTIVMGDATGDIFTFENTFGKITHIPEEICEELKFLYALWVAGASIYDDAE